MRRTKYLNSSWIISWGGQLFPGSLGCGCMDFLQILFINKDSITQFVHHRDKKKNTHLRNLRKLSPPPPLSRTLVLIYSFSIVKMH